MIICILLAIILPLAAIASVIVSIHHYREAADIGFGRVRSEQELKEKKARRTSGMLFMILAIVFVLLFVFLPWNFRTVDSGEVAVVKNFGKVIDVREPGIHTDFWITKSYVTLDTKVRQVDIVTSSYSNDKQTMDIQMTVQYQIKKDMAKEIVIQYGNLNMLESRIQSVAIERTKAIMSAYTADSLIEERSIISAAVADAVELALGESYFIDITNVALTNIDFSDAYEQAVEQKMIATQEVEKAKADAQKAEETAKGQLKVAEQEAEAKKVAADADAYAKTAAAEAEAEAIAIKSLEVARMLGLTVVVDEVEVIKPNLTADESKLISDYLKYIEYLSVWNGVLPGVMTDSGSIMIPVP